jgi:UDP-glucuronate decarboxylase
VRTIRTAVQGTLNMLDLAREAHARILISSTSEIYGDPVEHPQRESYWGNVNPIGPRACYDEGKRCAEALAVSYATQYGVEVRIARIFNTYGPRMHENDGRVVSNFTVQALRHEPITVYGEGQQTRSFCFVSDLIEGFTRLMASKHGVDPVNLGNPREIIRAPLPKDDPTRRRPDISRAQQLLDGWGPRVGLEEGLAATIADFKRRLSL